MSPNPTLPKGLADLLAATPAVSEGDLKRLKKAGAAIARDATSRAELQKALFVNSILAALNSEHLTKSEVARRMNCTRQYLNRILDEDHGVNFTIETMSTVATAANRRIELLVLAENEVAHVLKCQESIKQLAFSDNWFSVESGASSNIIDIFSEYYPKPVTPEVVEISTVPDAA